MNVQLNFMMNFINLLQNYQNYRFRCLNYLANSKLYLIITTTIAIITTEFIYSLKYFSYQKLTILIIVLSKSMNYFNIVNFAPPKPNDQLRYYFDHNVTNL